MSTASNSRFNGVFELGGERHPGHDVAFGQHLAGRHPPLVIGPAGDVGREERHLAERLQPPLLLLVDRFVLEGPQGAGDPFDGLAGTAVDRLGEAVRPEDGLDQRQDLEVVVPEDGRQFGTGVVARGGAGEEVVEAPGDEWGAGVAVAHRVDDHLRGPTFSPAEERQRPRVVRFRIERDLARLVVDAPTRQASGGDPHVVLGVVPGAECHELHQLSAVVLVGCVASGIDAVEPVEHGAADGHVLGQLPEVAQRVAPEDVVLAPHEVGGGPIDARCEVVVPEPRQSLVEPRLGGEQPLDPPLGQAVVLLAGQLTVDVVVAERPSVVVEQGIDQRIRAGVNPFVDLTRIGSEGGATKEMSDRLRARHHAANRRSTCMR